MPYAMQSGIGAGSGFIGSSVGLIMLIAVLIGVLAATDLGKEIRSAFGFGENTSPAGGNGKEDGSESNTEASQGGPGQLNGRASDNEEFDFDLNVLDADFDS